MSMVSWRLQKQRNYEPHTLRREMPRLLKKGVPSVRIEDKRTAGAEAHVDFAALAARLKSCPVTKRSRIQIEMSFSAA